MNSFNSKTFFAEKFTKMSKIMDGPRPKNWFLFADENGVFNFKAKFLMSKNNSELTIRKNIFKPERENFVLDEIGKIKSDERRL